MKPAMQMVSAMAWAMALMVTPDNLIVLGNSAAKSGGGWPLLVLLIAIGCVLNARAYALINDRLPGRPGELLLLKTVFGPPAALCLSVFVRLGVACLIATSVLVSSGYVFNEVFVYWFPNFAFAFILLAGLLLINLAGSRLSSCLQTILIIITIGALCILAAAGLLGLQNLDLDSLDPLAPIRLDALLPAALLFIGLDLAYLQAGSQSPRPATLFRSMTASLTVAGLIFCIWGWLSVVYVPSARLAETSIPHILAARRILGQPGRILIGIVIIAGSCAAVNALLQAVARLVQSGVALQLLPHFFIRGGHRLPIPLMVTSAAIAAMMALGVAGSEMLDTYIRAGLILWLLLYAGLHLALILAQRYRDLQTLSWQVVPYRLLHFFAFVGLSLIAIGLIVIDSQTSTILRFIGLALGLAVLLSWVLIQSTRH